MEPKQERKLELRSMSFFIAVVVALMGFSAALATKEQATVTPAAERSTPAYQDPSLAGLSVADDAEADDTVEFFN
jgi:hypothetical protein